MKRFLKALIIIAVLLLLAAAAFRHFVTNRVTDRGGMENPDFALVEETYKQQEYPVIYKL